MGIFGLAPISVVSDKNSIIVCHWAIYMLRARCQIPIHEMSPMKLHRAHIKFLPQAAFHLQLTWIPDLMDCKKYGPDHRPQKISVQEVYCGLYIQKRFSLSKLKVIYNLWSELHGPQCGLQVDCSVRWKFTSLWNSMWHLWNLIWLLSCCKSI